jgi:hypothetical protein
MGHLECPYCGTSISHGRNECSNCMAQIKYGASKFAYVPIAVISLMLGFDAAKIVPDRYSFIGWVLGWIFSIVLFVPASVVLARIFRHRVKFKMAYSGHKRFAHRPASLTHIKKNDVSVMRLESAPDQQC